MEQPSKVPIKPETLARLRDFAMEDARRNETRGLLIELAAAQCGMEPGECDLDLQAGVARTKEK